MNSTGEHFVAATNGIEDILEHPFGSGPGTAGPASFRNNGISKISENYFIQLGQEIGILGMVLFVWINILLGTILLKHAEASTIKPALFSALIGLTVVSMFLHGWADEEVAITFWGIAGLYLRPGN